LSLLRECTSSHKFWSTSFFFCQWRRTWQLIYRKINVSRTLIFCTISIHSCLQDPIPLHWVLLGLW
jgi:hypothetical protein